MSLRQVLTAEQMRAAEQQLFDAGTSVFELMEIAAGGAAEWIRRVAAGRPVTVLCGPGNNGGDGYVIARRLREAGNAVTVIAPLDPATSAAQEAKRREDLVGGLVLFVVLLFVGGRDGEVEIREAVSRHITNPNKTTHTCEPTRRPPRWCQCRRRRPPCSSPAPSSRWRSST